MISTRLESSVVQKTERQWKKPRSSAIRNVWQSMAILIPVLSFVRTVRLLGNVGTMLRSMEVRQILPAKRAAGVVRARRTSEASQRYALARGIQRVWLAARQTATKWMPLSKAATYSVSRFTGTLMSARPSAKAESRQRSAGRTPPPMATLQI